MNGQEVFKFAVRAVPTVSGACGGKPPRSIWPGTKGQFVGDDGAQGPGARRLTGRHGGGDEKQHGRCVGAIELPAVRGLLPSRIRLPCVTGCATHPHLLQVIEAALVNAGMEKQQIDWLVMHQANMRIMSAAADRLGVPPGEPSPAPNGQAALQPPAAAAAVRPPECSIASA